MPGCPQGGPGHQDLALTDKKLGQEVHQEACAGLCKHYKMICGVRWRWKATGEGTKRGDPLALPQEEEDRVWQRSQLLLDLPPRASRLLRAAKTFINVRFPAKGQIAHI